MPVQLVLGRAGSGKTHWVLESVRKHLVAGADPHDSGPAQSPLIILVPEQATFQTEYALISDPDLVGSVRAQVLSFRRLAWRILQQAGGAARPPIGELGKHMLLRALLARREGELEVFGKAARQAGFIQRLAQTLTELEAYNLSPEGLRRYSRFIEEPDSGLGAGRTEGRLLAPGASRFVGRKLHDLAVIYQAYQEYLQGRYTDPDGYLRLAAQKLKDVGWIAGARVWVDGFSDFTPQQYVLLEGLIQACQQVYITLGLDPDLYDQGRVRPPSDGEPFFITRETLHQLWLRAEKLKVGWLEPVRLPQGVAEPSGEMLPGTSPTMPMPRFKDGRLAHLEAEFFEQPGRPYPDCQLSGSPPQLVREPQPSAAGQPNSAKPAETGSDSAGFFFLGQPPSFKHQGIEVYACMNRQAEVEACAECLVELVRSRGYRWREVLVLASDLEIYHDLIATTFADYGIPYFIDRKRPVSHHPLVELVEGLLDLVVNHWDYESVFRILKTDFLPIPREQVDRLENYVLAYGIRGSLWYSQEPWRFHSRLTLAEDQELEPEGPVAQELQMINQIRQQVLDVLLPWYRQVSQALSSDNEASAGPGGRAPARLLTELLYRHLEKLGVPQTLHRWQGQAQTAGDLTAVQIHNLVWNGLVDLGDQLVEALGEERLSLTEYRDILATGLESLRLGLIPPSLDQVLVGAVERSRNPEAKAAFILGANEGLLPRTPTEDELLNDKERQELARLGLKLAPPSQQAVVRQQYLTYMALTRASKFLYLSYSLADEEGRALNPSLVIRKLKRLFPDLQEKYVGLEKSLGVTARQAAAFLVSRWSQLRVQANSGARNPDELMTLTALRRWLEADPSRRQEVGPVLASLNYDNQEKALPQTMVEQLYGLARGHTLRSSVSRLEQLAACPFAHFAAYGLGLKERKLFRLDPPSMGSFFHAALRTLVERLPQGGRSWSQLSPEEEELLARQVAEELTPNLQNEILLSTARYRYLAEVLKRTVVRAAAVLGSYARRGCFWPVAVELPFGMEARERGSDQLSLPAYEVNLGGGKKLLVRGVIDRVDVAWGPRPETPPPVGNIAIFRKLMGSPAPDWDAFDPAGPYAGEREGSRADGNGPGGNKAGGSDGAWYVRVIDYKSSKRSWRLDETYYGLSLQLLLYLAVAWRQAQRLVEPEANSALIVPAGMFYFAVQDPLAPQPGPTDPSRAEKALRSRLCLRGLVVGDPTVVQLMDREAWPSTSWQYVKALRDRGVVGQETVSASHQQMKLLLSFLDLRLKELGQRLLSGDVGIYPYRKGTSSACQFCLYRAVCQFERGVGGNRYRLLSDMQPDQLWSRLEAEVAGNELD